MLPGRIDATLTGIDGIISLRVGRKTLFDAHDMGEMSGCISMTPQHSRLSVAKKGRDSRLLREADTHDPIYAG